MTPTLIYCGGGNPRLARIAIEAGYKYGSQLPETVYGPLYFADQDWKKPNRAAYMAALAQHRPHMAADVVSADGNLAQKMATRWCQFWVPGTATYASNRWWPTLTEADGSRWDGDGPYEAFRRSCQNIIAAWSQEATA